MEGERDDALLENDKLAARLRAAEAQIADTEQALSSLQRHAESTIRAIEMFFKRRGDTTGKKKWEQALLVSAYNSLGRHFPAHPGR